MIGIHEYVHHGQQFEKFEKNAESSQHSHFVYVMAFFTMLWLYDGNFLFEDKQVLGNQTKNMND